MIVYLGVFAYTMLLKITNEKKIFHWLGFLAQK